jgi:hypothetical protein
MKTAERRELIARFRERNPVGQGAPWLVDEDALAESLVVVDPFRRFVRRVRRESASRDRDGADPANVSPRAAAAAARAFVLKNADLFGLAHSVALALGETVKPLQPITKGFVVHFDGRFPTKGYEAFPELENEAELDISIDGAGEVSGVANLSRIHPPLELDTHPTLAADDPRIFAHVLGSRGRIGEVSDVSRGVFRSEGPRLAWVTYRLVYVVTLEPSPVPAFSLSHYVVDADTGDLLEAFP